MRIWILTLLCSVAAHAFGDPVPAEELSLLLVPGFGEVSVLADQVELNGGIEVKGETADSLMDELERRLGILADSMAVLAGHKVELRLGDLTEGELRNTSEKGQRVYKKVSVFVPDLSVLDRITATLNAQGWASQSSAWTYSQEDRLRGEAYETACRDARAKAELLAKELKVEIVGVHRIYVDGLARRSTSYRYGKARDETTGFRVDDEGGIHMRGGGGLATSLSTQQVEFSKQVTVEFRIH